MQPATSSAPVLPRLASTTWSFSQRYWRLVVVAMLASAVMLWLDWWFLAFWVVVLAGLVGGKVYQQHARWQRRCYLVVFAYLLALLAIAILPEIAPRREIDADVRAYAEYVLPLAFVLIALFPSEPDSADAPHI